MYEAASGLTLSELQSAVQEKLDAGWSLAGSAFFGVNDGVGMFIQPLYHNVNYKEEHH